LLVLCKETDKQSNKAIAAALNGTPETSEAGRLFLSLPAGTGRFYILPLTHL